MLQCLCSPIEPIEEDDVRFALLVFISLCVKFQECLSHLIWYSYSLHLTQFISSLAWCGAVGEERSPE